jgi:hydrogenase expression/formation protein HypD
LFRTKETPVRDLSEAMGRLRARAAGLRGRLGRPVRVMEICGTHTVSISRSGLRSMLGGDLSLVSGPGCPVCVTDGDYIRQALDLARMPGLTVATYGDMLRVPGPSGSLAQARGVGADVLVVGSAAMALAHARANPHKQVVLLGVGFETTTPATALVVRQAAAEGAGNLSVLVAHKLVLPAMEALLSAPDIGIDAFLCPGHVSIMLGLSAYEPIVRRYGCPCVVGGFEPPNIVAALDEILRQLETQQPAAASVYAPVGESGNPVARAVVGEVLEPCDARWRALGVIPASGLRFVRAYRQFDAFERFDLAEQASADPPACRCAEVITGRCLPGECPLFGKLCTPRSPVGPCMVSSEGSCAAYYRYG